MRHIVQAADPDSFLDLQRGLANSWDEVPVATNTQDLNLILRADSPTALLSELSESGYQVTRVAA